MLQIFIARVYVKAIVNLNTCHPKVKVGVLRPVQQPE